MAKLAFKYIECDCSAVHEERQEFEYVPYLNSISVFGPIYRDPRYVELEMWDRVEVSERIFGLDKWSITMVNQLHVGILE